MGIRERALLIVDSDPALEKAFASELVFVKSPRQSLPFFMEKSHLFAAVFVNPLMSSPGIFEWIRTARRHRPLTPVFLIEDKSDESAFAKLQLERLGVRGVIEKPCALKDLWDLAKLLPVEPGLDTVNEREDQPDISLKDFRAVGIEECFTEIPQLFDVYVWRKSEKFIDIVRAGESFFPKLLRAHARRGVKNFYVRNDAVERSLGFCRTLSMTLPFAQGLSPALQQRAQLNSADDITERLKTAPEVTTEDIETAREFTSQVSSFVTGLDCRSDQAIRKLFDFVANTDHAVATTLVSAKLAPGLGLENDISVQILGVASLLHNIGLYRLPEKLWDEDESRMTPSELALYYTHPERGADILRSVEGVHPTVIQAVAQHHERRGGRGFPGKVVSSNLSPIAEAVGISNEFVKVVCKKKLDPKIDIFKELEARVFPLFSSNMVKLFKTAFWDL
ncbi:HD domain-containing phosphohydrolase [Bdellovibrionota bacterium FG-2]